ncbi:SHOCT domain-containing protein [Mycolicibacterium diernhoferi]|uniref:SHOCT domain-containing protein n=1 Tax=Mycolicibacterium diernhoferi TaxID=1801 RepID=A0A1Q4HF38_9MYCO|nr:hypothetical protein [Mycolicibacterium diernhoferi]OJZ66011.1 hypothetical protein BRW64_11435 [Mycolicibacterium diernhoferi]OPE55021.1 hypothetical protein BV510_07245 [Mycolicibacterium diernhoferi]PEG54626.1 hypothetical protein CRI78_10605 [Mycolicibacterium diernhoferi]QYL23916.1 SHOCT domain-containing protein [Mycolicibacterium diernhoferi]
MRWHEHDMGWWGYAGMGIGMVLFWTLLIAAVAALFIVLVGDRRRPSTPPMPPTTMPQTPEQILAARFARGEIGESEFRDRLAVLQSHQGPS